MIIKLASVIPYTDDGKIVLMLREKNRKSYPGCWSLIGGHMEVGESPEQAMKREMLEEIELDTKLTFLKTYSYTDTVYNEQIERHVFLTEIKKSLDWLKEHQHEGDDLVLTTKDSDYIEKMPLFSQDIVKDAFEYIENK